MSPSSPRSSGCSRPAIPQERIYLAWPSPPFYAPGDSAFDVAGTILSDGLSSRLQKALVYDKPLASDVGAFQFSLETAGMFVVQATARRGTSLDEIQRVISREIGLLAKVGPTTAELSRAKTKWEYNFNHRSRADRRVRRQGRPAQPVQHLPW